MSNNFQTPSAGEPPLRRGNELAGKLPITQLGLRNFRSIEQAEIDLRPLTIVVGGNSAGKSSILSTFRLLKQAELSSERDHVFPLEGVEVELGSFSDLIRQGCQEDSIEISLTFRILPPTRPLRGPAALRQNLELRGASPRGYQAKVNLALGESEGSTGVAADIQEFQVQLFSEDREFEFLNVVSTKDLSLMPDPVGQTDLELNRNWMVQSSFDPRVMREQQPSRFGLLGVWRDLQEDFGVEVYSKSGSGGIPVYFYVAKTRFEVLSLHFEHFRKHGVESFFESQNFRHRSMVRSRQNLKSSASLEDLLSNERILMFLERSSFSEFRDYLLLQFGSKEQAVEEVKTAVDGGLSKLGETLGGSWHETGGFPLQSVSDSRTPEIMRVLGMYLQRQVTHMGPLRQGPRRLYSFGERSAANELGREAQYFAHFLRENRDLKIPSFQPDSTGERTLIEELGYWTSYLNVANSIEVREAPGYGRQVLVSLPGLLRPVDWEKVGVGVSQILPVLLKVLTSREGSITLMEQPELHLHPDAQANLADFLIAAAAKGRNLIVETHSDALITRIRRRVAEEALKGQSRTAESTTFIYASRDESSGITSLRNVDLTEGGGFEDWPAGFADQTSKEALELIQQQVNLARERTHS